LPLDIEFVFTANPEDYTNRGAIITPLKDRIESQILTHYPKDIRTSRLITEQEAAVHDEQQQVVIVNDLAKDLIEQIAVEARKSEYVDQRSGVSARMTITMFENLVSAAERRALKNREEKTHVRVSDCWGVIPSITGKVELVYEGEQEGPLIVAINLIGKAIRTLFTEYFPAPEKIKKTAKQNTAATGSRKPDSIYESIVAWFRNGNQLDLLNDSAQDAYHRSLLSVPGLKKLVEKYYANVSSDEQFFLMEFVLHGLAEFSLLSRNTLIEGTRFRDLFSTVFSGDEASDPDEEDFQI
jgi:magnesium chelatase subunit I